MTKLPIENLPQLYGAMMREIKLRLDATEDMFQQAVSAPSKPRAILDCEFCYLQLRRCCELVALASLIAHNGIDDFRNGRLLDEDSGPRLIKLLSNLSDDAFPEPATVENRRSDGSADLKIADDAEENRRKLNKIYGDCGDRLHTGSLKSLLKAGGKRYDFGEIQRWKNFFVHLLNVHTILMPDRTAVMIVFMRNDDGDDVKCEFSPIEQVGDHRAGNPAKSQPPA